ncbi:MAG: phosphate ABC transporter permease subunit PstC [Actinomycetota bacterium]|nr:phosphate ABC transporter permease subunit PstC [Actinomycetota bacterium]
MALELQDGPTGSPGAGAGLVGRRPRFGDRLFGVATLVSGLSVLAVLALIAGAMGQKALPAFREEGIGFITSSRWAPNLEVFGALAFVGGTLLISLIALVFAVPVSMGIALFLSELAPRRLRRPVIYLIDLLAAVPSVVFGLWGLLVLGPSIVGLYERVARAVDGVPVLGTLFGPPVNGKSLFTAGLILALMITPIVTSITREVFDTVPAAQKEAAYALSATRWEMIRGAVFPHSRSGVIGAVMLGLGRAMGETIAAALVIGSSPQLTARLFGSGDALAAVIANQFGEAGGLHRSALIGLGVVLFAMTIVVNVVARGVVGRAPMASGWGKA